MIDCEQIPKWLHNKWLIVNKFDFYLWILEEFNSNASVKDCLNNGFYCLDMLNSSWIT